MNLLHLHTFSSSALPAFPRRPLISPNFSLSKSHQFISNFCISQVVLSCLIRTSFSNCPNWELAANWSCMTSASELFYQRRSRIGRHSDSFGVGSDLGSPPPPLWINRRHRHNNTATGNHSRRDRLDPDGCNPLRRPSHHPRQTSLHRSSHPPQVRILF